MTFGALRGKKGRDRSERVFLVNTQFSLLVEQRGYYLIGSSKRDLPNVREAAKEGRP